MFHIYGIYFAPRQKCTILRRLVNKYRGFHILSVRSKDGSLLRELTDREGKGYKPILKKRIALFGRI